MTLVEGLIALLLIALICYLVPVPGLIVFAAVVLVVVGVLLGYRSTRARP